MITYKSPICVPPPRLLASCLRPERKQTSYTRETSHLPCHIEFCMDDRTSSSPPARESLDIEPSSLKIASSARDPVSTRTMTCLLLMSIDNMLTSLVRWRRWSGRDGVSIANDTSGDWRMPGVITIGMFRSYSMDRFTGV